MKEDSDKSDLQKLEKNNLKTIQKIRYLKQIDINFSSNSHEMIL